MSEKNVSPQNLPFTLKPGMIILILVVLAVLVGAGTSFFVVDQTEEAIVTRFGRYQRRVGPGLQTKLPFGIEQNHNVQTQVVQNMSFGFRTQQAGVQTRYDSRDYSHESIMLTGDLNIVDVEWIIQYRIAEPYNWLFKVEDRDQTIRDISQSVMNELVGDRAILDVISSERRNIEFRSEELLNEIFNEYELGIRVTSVRLQNIVPPRGRVQDAFEDVNRAIQDMNRKINEGRRAFNEEIPRARGEADRMLQTAEGYAARRVNTARGDVARFNAILTEYRQQPQVTRVRLYNELMESLFDQEDSVNLIDRQFTNLLPLLNLDTVPGGQQ
ncbi:FtsH protease activity modulator HflK [Spirochaeta africana]|uniref:Protein HflK n=1 Tax=Spirochaeta africana (strain ATCC 700263 / DSM 8902 / Z-7692) TaxID=889378 RepID=H9UJS6_SPIAZ|nr:FtsH protease activity modulator HflK [Spirochaeta africana]AFG37769.1 HflK protein [Spirochaeta africana DSM 8902]